MGINNVHSVKVNTKEVSHLAVTDIHNITPISSKYFFFTARLNKYWKNPQRI